MDNLNVDKIRTLLDKNDKISIAVGKNPGIDEMAASLALYLSLSNSGKTVSIACPTEPIVEVSSLVGIDKVQTTLHNDAADLTVSFPDRGDIEKISYTREDGFINIIVKAGKQGLSFDETDIQYKRFGAAPSVIFIVGTPRLSDLGSVFDAEKFKDTTVINIDNKESNQGFGDIILVSKDLSSVSESVASLISSLGLNLDTDTASNLLAGISEATDNFQNPRTSPLAFETVAMLMKKGAKRTMQAPRKTLDAIEDRDPFFTTSLPKKTEHKTEKKRDDNPPDDWLAPKIYKGSTAI
ncbi:MAG: hypothetical protein A3B41_00975 [Candidatus Levybacteria bacterium RIFCSPLOWO2_01_FULL_37_26]|nr:MAG: hypothetical protein A3E40_00425 [Candidatus Levybacteria bacterium RIFCSPHIGHO2_12_FULL_37_9]OGH39681.1 MAG: hypothetical protein A3B41_00975 [Candidatus Levybacteria bacterium RIFCSPLOWO2_01_FULL_37_26]